MNRMNQSRRIMPPPALSDIHLREATSAGNSSDAREQRWLRPARVTWLAIVVPAYALWLTHLPAYVAAVLRQPSAGDAPIPIASVQLALADLQRLHAWGLPFAVYATGMIAVTLLFQLSYAAVGLLLFWRRADDQVAFFASFALMMLPFGFAQITLGALPPDWRWIIPLVGALGNGSLIFCGYVFPDGRFAPRWVRLLAIALAGYSIVAACVPAAHLDHSQLSLLIFLGFALSVLPIQAYRYHAVSTPFQRQQTKWVVLGMTVGVIGNIAARTLYALVLVPLWSASALAYAAQVVLIMVAMLAIPFTVGLAILASHLWDIDLVIQRTLVYSALSTLLAAIYAVTILALQTLIHAFTATAQPGPFVIAASTLLVVIVTNPLRRWLQAVIDRRFYRRKYQAEHVLRAFAGTLHSEIELSQLRERLLTVIEETMQPSHISLWLSPSSEGTRETSRPVTLGDHQMRQTSSPAVLLEGEGSGRIPPRLVGEGARG